ncbi:MAG: glycoside hydrolase family 99-like domain-containing protein [Actinomycetes bacterium]
MVAHGSTPERFRVHVRDAVERLTLLPAAERLLIVKSWNEWGEGNHLEPDQRWGRSYFEVLRDEVCR